MHQGGGGLTTRRERATLAILVWPHTLACFSETFLYFVLCPTKISFFLAGNEYLGVKKLNSPLNTSMLPLFFAPIVRIACGLDAAAPIVRVALGRWVGLDRRID
jgi:hypothetical protein